VTTRTVPGRCPLCPAETPKIRIAQGRDFEYGTTPLEFTVVRCDGCGIQFLDPRPADDEIAGLYPDTYIPYRMDQLPAPVRAARDFVQRSKVRAIAEHTRATSGFAPIALAAFSASCATTSEW